MERIYPPHVKAWMMRNGKVAESDCLYEIGIFSTLFLEQKELLVNQNMGYLMRTKGSHFNEGGVNSGYAVIDLPVLYVEEKNQVGERLKANVDAINN